MNTSPNANVEKKDVSIQQQRDWVLRHMFMNLIVLIAPFQTRNILVGRLTGGDDVKTAAVIAQMSASCGLVEFLLNPILGNLSDKFGRKPFMLLSPAVNFLTKLNVYMTKGTSMNALMLDRVLGGACTTVSGSTTSSAALSDVLSGDELAGAFGKLGSYAGMGVLLGPALSGQLLAATGDPLDTYLLGAAAAAAQLAMNASCFQETLPLDKRRPINPRVFNPFAFTKIFTNAGSVTARLCAVAGLQCFPEGKSLADVNMSYMQSDVKMSAQEQTFFVMAFGVSMIAAGRLPSKLIGTVFTKRSFTSLSNLMTVFALGIWGASQSKLTYWLGLSFLCPSMERRSATSAMATDHAVANKMGRGEFQACFANWRALCVAAAPLLYSKAYAWGKQRGVPGAAYLSAAGIVIFTEGLFRTIKERQLEVPK